MKLRNKKTGEKVDIDFIYPETAEYFHPDYKLRDLFRDWEDVKEPIIKDKEIRKVVRAWAKVNHIKEIIIFDYKNAGFGASFDEVYFAENGGRLEIHFRTEERFDTDRRYTITELCGDES